MVNSGSSCLIRKKVSKKQDKGVYSTIKFGQSQYIIMGKFMINIQLEGLDTETRMKLLPREQELVKELEQNGTIIETYIKLDMSGIYMVIVAADSDDVHSKLSILPYYPFMKIDIVPIRMINHINQ
jgi:muconolactone D-isomerase